jgi:hypothetical protein
MRRKAANIAFRQGRRKNKSGSSSHMNHATGDEEPGQSRKNALEDELRSELAGE